MDHLAEMQEERDAIRVELQHYEGKLEQIQNGMLKKAEQETKDIPVNGKAKEKKKSLASKITSTFGFSKRKSKTDDNTFPLAQPKFVARDDEGNDIEALGHGSDEEWAVLPAPDEVKAIEGYKPRKGKFERNIEKFQEVKENWDEFCERSRLVMQSVTTLVEELKLQITVKFTTLIQL